MDAIAGSGAGRAGPVATLGGAFEEGLAHLRAAGVLEADEEGVGHQVASHAESSRRASVIT
jgi:hypothetical protein